MNIKLYHSPLTCSLASRLALTAAEVDHDLVLVRTQLGENARPEYLAVNPVGKVPALSVDGVVLTESTAILPFIATLALDAGLMPQDPLGRAQAQALLGYCSSTLHAAWTGVFRPERFTSAPHTDPVRNAAIDRLVETLHHLEGRLGGRPYLLGDRSVCDLYLAVFLVWRSAAPMVQGRLPVTPGLDGLQARVFAEPALGAVLSDDLSLRSATAQELSR